MPALRVLGPALQFERRGIFDPRQALALIQSMPALIERQPALAERMHIYLGVDGVGESFETRLRAAVLGLHAVELFQQQRGAVHFGRLVSRRGIHESM